MEPLSPFSDYWANTLVTFPAGESQDVATPKPSPKKGTTSPKKANRRNQTFVLPPEITDNKPTSSTPALIKATSPN